MDPTLVAGAIVILLFSVILHEVAHGWMALKFGDRTALNAGRLTLNPLPHIDLMGTILVPLIFILPMILFPGVAPRVILGWAKPVPVNPFNFKNIRQGELYVSAAGVITNLVLALLALVLFYLIGNISNTVFGLLIYTIRINIILAFFNLLPIHPLDGSKILASFLPAHLVISYQKMEKYGMVALLLFLFFPIGGTTLWGIIIGILLSIFSAIFQIPL